METDILTRRKFMGLFTRFQHELLINNGSDQNHGKDHIPVAYLTAGVVRKLRFLITEMYNIDNVTVVYGLLQNVDEISIKAIALSELEKVNESEHEYEMHGLINDIGFNPRYPLTVFQKVAEEMGSIVANSDGFESIFEKYTLK